MGKEEKWGAKEGKKKSFSIAHTGKSSFSTITSEQRVRERERARKIISHCACSGGANTQAQVGKRGHMIEELMGLLFIKTRLCRFHSKLSGCEDKRRRFGVYLIA